MIVKTDDQLKLEEIWGKNKDESYTMKTSEYKPTGFTMSIYYIEYIKCKLIKIEYILLTLEIIQENIAGHSICNLYYKEKKIISTLGHNGSSHDNHLISPKNAGKSK